MRHASTRMRTPYERPHGEGHGSSSRAPRDRQSDPSCRIFVGNLSYETSWQDLKDFMRQAGEVVHADVLINAMGRSKGCGVVEFASADDAKKAMETLNDKELMGRPVFIREVGWCWMINGWGAHVCGGRIGSGKRCEVRHGFGRGPSPREGRIRRRSWRRLGP